MFLCIAFSALLECTCVDACSWYVHVGGRLWCTRRRGHEWHHILSIYIINLCMHWNSCTVVVAQYQLVIVTAAQLAPTQCQCVEHASEGALGGSKWRLSPEDQWVEAAKNGSWSPLRYYALIRYRKSVTRSNLNAKCPAWNSRVFRAVYMVNELHLCHYVNRDWLEQHGMWKIERMHVHITVPFHILYCTTQAPTHVTLSCLWEKGPCC